MPAITDQVVAITGASAGIGAATATLLAARGCRVVLGARGEERLVEVAGRIADAGGAVAWRGTDVASRADVAALVDLAVERHGRLDVMINNAGSGPISPFDDLRVEDWERIVDVNVKGVLYGIAAALPVFRRQGAGHMITVGSTAAHRLRPPQTVYAAAKTAVRVICEGLRQEAGDSLRVTLITPGMTKTGFTDDIHDDETRAQMQATVERVGLDPGAVADTIAWAIEQPAEVELGEIIIRPTAQA